MTFSKQQSGINLLPLQNFTCGICHQVTNSHSLGPVVVAQKVMEGGLEIQAVDA